MSGEPTLLTCGVCRAKAPEHVHHLTDCIDNLRAERARLESELMEARAKGMATELALSAERQARVEAERWAAEWRLCFDQECRIYDEACAKLEASEAALVEARRLLAECAHAMEREAPYSRRKALVARIDAMLERDAALGAEPGDAALGAIMEPGEVGYVAPIGGLPDAALTQKEGRGAPAARFSPAAPACSHAMFDESCARCKAWAETLPCPHARPSWRGCPHCLGINGSYAAQAAPSPSISGIAADKGEGRDP